MSLNYTQGYRGRLDCESEPQCKSLHCFLCMGWLYQEHRNGEHVRGVSHTYRYMLLAGTQQVPVSADHTNIGILTNAKQTNGGNFS